MTKKSWLKFISKLYILLKQQTSYTRKARKGVVVTFKTIDKTNKLIDSTGIMRRKNNEAWPNGSNEFKSSIAAPMVALAILFDGVVVIQMSLRPCSAYWYAQINWYDSLQRILEILEAVPVPFYDHTIYFQWSKEINAHWTPRFRFKDDWGETRRGCQVAKKSSTFRKHWQSSSSQFKIQSYLIPNWIISLIIW